VPAPWRCFRLRYSENVAATEEARHRAFMRLLSQGPEDSGGIPRRLSPNRYALREIGCISRDGADKHTRTSSSRVTEGMNATSDPMALFFTPNRKTTSRWKDREIYKILRTGLILSPFHVLVPAHALVKAGYSCSTISCHQERRSEG